jgi:hypothetical protein
MLSNSGRTGNNLHSDIINGASPALRALLEKQYKGLAPHEEGNVDEYLQKIGQPRISAPRKN